MNLDYSISCEPPLIVVQTAGLFDFPQTFDMWKAIVAACKAGGCMRILGTSNLQATMPSSNAYESFTIFEAVGITNDYRIAWVAGNTVVLEQLRVVEAVLKNRGFINHCVFESLDKARDWLLKTE